MASEAYIRNQLEYLKAGNLSDLTLNFGERSWKAHKAIACSHSQWFRRAVTGAFEESSSGVVTLEDEPEFADAIDCMVSYFYSAGYSASDFTGPAALLHARVAVIADKYDCAALFDVAKAGLAGCIGAAEVDDWVAIADLVYHRTTADLPAHAGLRDTVAGAAAGRIGAAELFLRTESVEELLRSNADLATDLLLSSAMADRRLFVCGNCSFAHIGSLYCAKVVAEGYSLDSCPQCGASNGKKVSKKAVHKIGLSEGVPCSSCHGSHTLHIPEPSPSPSPSPFLFP